MRHSLLNMAVLLISVTLMLALCHAQDKLDTVNVTTSLGTVTGLFVTNSNIQYYSFKGIPYANVTERFKGPTSMKPWQSVVLAFSDGPMCPQPKFVVNMPDSDQPQNEECLYMNIFTPKLPQGEDNHPKLPVMVYFHGSGFIVSSSSSNMYGPEFFMVEKDVVLVTINYRLGVFGFLSTGTKDAQGNAGLKDQVEALKWVKQEIVHFGGDPSRVTIFGESAGGVSVVLHMISPMSKGLFHASSALQRATRIAELLYCNIENTTTIVGCLRKMSVSAINQALSEILAEEGAILSTVPVIETNEFYEEAFLPDTPSNLLDNFNDSSCVPLIIGTNKDEGMLMISFDDQVYEQMDKNLHLLIPSSVGKNSTKEQIAALTQKLRQFYFNGGAVTKATTKGVVDVWTDYLFMYPAAQTVRKLVAKKNDVYLYHLVYQRQTAVSYWEEKLPKIDYKGVEHGADIAFLFYSPVYGQNLTDTVSDDYKVTKRWVKLWTAFAKTGSPISTTDETIKDIKWPKVADESELTYLEINSTFSVGKNYYEERVAFWDQLTSNSDTLSKDEF